MAAAGYNVLITGGTGSLGTALIQHLLELGSYKGVPFTRVVSFARSESRQKLLDDRFVDYPQFRTFLGDVRDVERLRYAMRGIDIVVHAAALKRVDASCDQPMETIKTNILGTDNVLEAAAHNHVGRVMVVSSDKAVEAANIYGATKACCEHLSISQNSFAHRDGTSISVVRYGNVLTSTGSAYHIFMAQASRPPGQPFTVTHPRMSRFVITMQEAVQFVWRCVVAMRGGEIFVPILPSISILDLTTAIDPERPVEYIGLRAGGEKLAETLISRHEAPQTVQHRKENFYVINPSHHPWRDTPIWPAAPERDVIAVAPGFAYTSDQNCQKLTVSQLRSKLGITILTGEA